MTIPSILNLYRAGVGPSSSHSMGPRRAARIFLDSLTAQPARARVTLYGSLASTGRGHLSDRAICAEFGACPCEIVWDLETTDLPHPNTLKFEAFAEDGSLLREWLVRSVGGGRLEDASGPVGEEKTTAYPVDNVQEAVAHCKERDWTLWQLVESREDDLWGNLGGVWEVMCASVQRGLSHDGGLLPGELRVPRKAAQTYHAAKKLDSPRRDLALLSAFALSVAEENAAGGEVVAAPTCGAAGVVPGLLYYYETEKAEPRRRILEALATAGLFGVVIQANASISGAEVGCQGEIGSACSMAAAAAAQLLGGSLDQIEYAAEIAMEHNLGLTCDPVLGYVQIPCIERNMAACVGALECATFALLTEGDHLVSFDDVVGVMNETGRSLQSAYRETARGGLALLWEKRRAKSED